MTHEDAIRIIEMLDRIARDLGQISFAISLGLLGLSIVLGAIGMRIKTNG